MIIYTEKEDLINSLNIRNISDMSTISEELLADPDVIVELIKKDQSLVNVLSDRLLENRDTLERVFDEVDSTIYHRLSPELKNNKKFMSELLVVDENAQYNLGDKLKNNIDIKKILGEMQIKKQENIDIEKGVPSELENIMGKEKYALLKNYPITYNEVHNAQYKYGKELFSDCIKYINDKETGSIEWKKDLQTILTSFNSKEFDALLKDASVDKSNVDVKELFSVLKEPNYFNIENINDLKEYDNIKTNICDSILNEENSMDMSKYEKINEMPKLEQKKFALTEKLYNVDVKTAKNLTSKFYNIEDLSANKGNDFKSYFSSMKEIIACKSEEIFKSIFEKNATNKPEINIENCEKDLKELYVNEYNDSLIDLSEKEVFNKEELNKILEKSGIDKNVEDMKDINFIDPGKDFNMIITSISPIIHSAASQNYAESWNREITDSNTFSCSYIGNDMRGTTSVPNICYGFNNLDVKSLQLAGSVNLGSSADKNELKTNENYVEYATPQELKNTTNDYNEMVFNRVQNGSRKQPDYIVAFAKNGEIDNIQNILNAHKDYKEVGIELPIVIVDREKCIENEKSAIADLIEEYKNTNNKDLFESAQARIKNNSVTDRLEFQEISKQLYSTEKELNNPNKDVFKNAYETTSPTDRKNVLDELKNFNKELANNKNYENER